ncbi:hypothetical protein [Herbiconiux sp. L3-i23]|uniref:hypothetical protein n=1 Tax=Herbiconiux sp. L3-i23 TaxID=2905871 RepID=UPI0020469CA6|nr:hypothetical protein [Herbiconiux sp. L3-i23]BDI23542.1 hypothetical protein L3i23_23180 [Herbiconiux sp. L3-i23]
MSQTVVEGRSPFFPSPTADYNYAAIGQHPLFREVAPKIEGWGELTAAADRVASLEVPAFDRSPVDDVTLADAIVDGADPVEMVQQRNATMGRNAALETASHLLGAARRQLTARAERWVDSHRSRIAAEVSSALGRVAAKASPLVQGPLASIRSGADLAKHPKAAAAFGEFAELAEQFADGAKLADALAPLPPHSDYDRFPALNLLGDYPAAFPTFYLSKWPLAVTGEGGRQVAVIPDSVPPWTLRDERDLLVFDDPVARLRYFAGNELPITVAATSQDLAVRLEKLQRLAEQRRAERAAKEAARG